MKTRIYRTFTKMSKIVYPASERNQSHILNVIKHHIPATASGALLEIASGTGQHCAHFAPSFPQLKFQPSEYEASLLGSIRAYAKETPAQNILDPVVIDITEDVTKWPIEMQKFDYALNVNMMHISPYDCTVSLFKNISRLLKPAGLMITYGPYANDGLIEPQSNVNFDASLRAQNTQWGLRDIVDLKKLATANGIVLIEVNDLPANNKCLIWKKH